MELASRRPGPREGAEAEVHQSTQEMERITMITGRSTNRHRWLILAAFMAAGLAACDRDSPTDPGNGDEHGDPVAAQVFDRSTGELLAYTHGVGAGIHWDGGVPHLEVGEEIALDVVFLDEDDREVPLTDEFEVRARFADGAPEGVIEFSNHGDHIDVEAVGAGTTEIVLMLWHGGHSDWDSPPLQIHVEVEGGEPVGVEIRDRDSGELLAETDGVGEGIHWDGALPDLTVGGEIEVDVIFVDAAGEAVPLGGGYEARLALAEGAAEGIISWENHIDHIDIEGEAPGTTSVVFQFWHDDHVDWESPAIEISVTDP
jgi:hypothetical protein